MNDYDDAWTLNFNADGTMSYNHNGEPHTGRWYMEDARMIHYHFDDEAEGQGDGSISITMIQTGLLKGSKTWMCITMQHKKTGGKR